VNLTEKNCLDDKAAEGAKIFCRVRSYLLTAQKHGITATDALKTLFAGKLPDVFF